MRLGRQHGAAMSVPLPVIGLRCRPHTTTPLSYTPAACSRNLASQGGARCPLDPWDCPSFEACAAPRRHCQARLIAKRQDGLPPHGPPPCDQPPNSNLLRQAAPLPPCSLEHQPQPCQGRACPTPEARSVCGA